MSNREPKQPAQPAQLPVLVPDGFPSYLRFAPSADTVEMNNQVQAALDQLDKAVRTSNHLQAHQLASNHLLPALVMMYQGNLFAQRDLLTHMHELASYTAEASATNLDEDLVEMLADHLDALADLLGLVEGLATESGVAAYVTMGAAELAEKQKLLAKLCTDLRASHTGLVDYLEAAVEGEEDEEESEDDDDADEQLFEEESK